MMTRFSRRGAAVLNCVAVTALSVVFAALLLAGCSKEKVPSDVGTGDPLAELPVVLSRQALVVQDQTRGIGTLFNEAAFQERNREAERVKAEHEAHLARLDGWVAETKGNLISLALLPLFCWAAGSLLPLEVLADGLGASTHSATSPT